MSTTLFSNCDRDKHCRKYCWPQPFNLPIRPFLERTYRTFTCGHGASLLLCSVMRSAMPWAFLICPFCRYDRHCIPIDDHSPRLWRSGWLDSYSDLHALVCHETKVAREPFTTLKNEGRNQIAWILHVCTDSIACFLWKIIIVLYHYQL